MHGLFSMYLDADVMESFAVFGHRELISTINAPLCPFHLTMLIEQRSPVLRQKPHGLMAPMSDGSCRMCIPMCCTNFVGCEMERGRFGHFGQRHSSRIVPWGLPSSSQIKQTSSRIFVCQQYFWKYCIRLTFPCAIRKRCCPANIW